MAWQELFVPVSTKPRGMAVAKAKAKEIFERGGSIKHCPYQSKSWRSVFAGEIQRLQQTTIFQET